MDDCTQRSGFRALQMVISSIGSSVRCLKMSVFKRHNLSVSDEMSE